MGASVRTHLTLAQYKLLNVFIRRSQTGLAFEIQIAIHAVIHAFLQKKADQYQQSMIKFLTDFAFFDQLQVRTLITRH